MAPGSAGGIRRVRATSFVSIVIDEPDQAVILLRGDVDAATVHRLQRRIDDVLGGPPRYITIDARAAGCYDQTLLDLLSRTQRRLARRRGTLRVLGLHPALLTRPDPRHGHDTDPAARTRADAVATASVPHRRTAESVAGVTS